MISEKASKIGISPTLKISAKAKAMKAEGIDVVDLSVGEPDFSTPDNVKAAGIKAIEQDFTKYTANDGIPVLKEAIGNLDCQLIMLDGKWFNRFDPGFVTLGVQFVFKRLQDLLPEFVHKASLEDERILEFLFRKAEYSRDASPL